MTDVHDSITRSYNMSRIRGTNTKPEMLIRRFLFSYGFRYRLHVKNLPGTPDIVLPKYNTIIQINGCFWHGHEGCRYATIPKTRTDWWNAKILNNKLRDRHNKEELILLGWNVIEIFECELKKEKLQQALSDLLQQLGAYGK